MGVNNNVSRSNSSESCFEKFWNGILTVEDDDLLRIFLDSLLIFIDLRLVDVVLGQDGVPEIVFRYSCRSHASNIHVHLLNFHEELDVTKVCHPLLREELNSFDDEISSSDFLSINFAMNVIFESNPIDRVFTFPITVQT